ncbi:MAG: HAMP domain-containing sensor histidine kinase [Bacteroidota bacterium]|nr:HAMP domain-containing sensor histidine kinase [Bacteroidota bacterium]
MNFSLTNRRLFLILATVFALALVFDIISESNIKYRLEANALENKLHRAEKEGMKYLQRLSDGDSLFKEPEYIHDLHSNRIYSLFKYTGGQLTAWTNNSILLPSVYDDDLFSDKIIKLDNRRAIVKKLEKEDDIYLCLINIYREYSIENKYLKSGFNPELGLKAAKGLSINMESGFPIYSSEGQYLFSLVFDKTTTFISGITIIPLILWLLFSFIFLLASDRIAKWLVFKGFSYLGFIASLQLIIIFYFIFLLLDKPGIFTGMEIFSSFRFNLGPLVPSAGHLLLLSVLFLFACLEFYKYFPDPSCDGQRPWMDFLKLTVFFSISAFIFFLFNRLLHALILDSNIHFRIYEILDVDIFTVISIAAAGLILVGLSIYLLRFVRFCKKLPLKTNLPALIVSLIILYLLNILAGEYSIVHILVFLLLLIQAWFFGREKSRMINISVSFAIITAAYAAYLIPGLAWQKETEKLKVISVNFSNQNDIYGEALLLDLWPELEKDSLLQEMMNKDFLSPDDVNAVYSYLDSAYFTGYWDNYDRMYTICKEDSPLYFESDTDRVENCFDFFQIRAREMGIPVSDSNLVFLDNNSGRPYYLGCLYFTGEKRRKTGLFIELIHLLKYTQSGYPELLIDKEYDKRINTGDYSIAKYINGSLVLQTGDYPFRNNLEYLVNDSTGYHTVSLDADKEYFIYSTDKITVVVFRPRLTFIDIIITFTYLFVAFFILHLLMLVIIRPPENIFPGTLNFTHKLQVAFIGILLGSIVAIGTVVVILSINQYRSKHYENIEEKLGSVYIELDHKLSEVDTLTQTWSADSYPNLDALLIKFSNVFSFDINLYDTNGELIATSRREVFNNKLKSKRMNYEAYTRLKHEGQAQYIQNERIGKLEYLSAYTPYVNNRNEVLVYLNLPYFNMQSRINEETSNLIVAMINFTMILIVISLSIAVFISVRITNPLRMLQQGLASVRLGEKSKPLEYRGHDEISELVQQYNKMLDELQASAMKLARSEREDAWREMAKQIAHEIKNPLTPMKLNVQQLYKKWKDKPENFEESLESFKQYQIEQINNLSSIASAFSSFARMPKANPRETDLVAHINAAADLYSDIKNIDININYNGLKEVKVFADKEQMKSMLSNIIRNAVQAIPASRRGIINISLSVKDQKALIRVEDNGVGIPDKLKDKLFAPNFTTKSSGMGLGLAIVKRVVETADGRIWFESEPGKGSVFYVEYPLLSYSR